MKLLSCFQSINDLPSAVKNAGITIYADDSTVYYATTTCHESNQVLSSELNIVYDWVKTNKFALIISKTKWYSLWVSTQIGV